MTDVALHIADCFPILSVTLITEPLRVANRELGREAFTWQLVSDAGGLRRASSGLSLDTVPMSARSPDVAILLASYKPESASTPETLAWLRALDRRGCVLGCVDTGALVFARAGLLGRRPAAAHPEAIAGFHRQFPDSLFVDRMYDVSPPRVSSAGGVATLDMTLGLIAHFTSPKVAGRVAQILTYAPPVAGWVPQALPKSIPVAVADAVALMQAHLAGGMRVSDIAAQLGLPVWTLRRQFQRYLHMTPTSYFVHLRLAKARDMLRNTTLPVGDIASACGYENADAFSRAYRTRYAIAPSQDRSL